MLSHLQSEYHSKAFPGCASKSSSKELNHLRESHKRSLPLVKPTVCNAVMSLTYPLISFLIYLQLSETCLSHQKQITSNHESGSLTTKENPHLSSSGSSELWIALRENLMFFGFFLRCKKLSETLLLTTKTTISGYSGGFPQGSCCVGIWRVSLKLKFNLRIVKSQECGNNTAMMLRAESLGSY